MPKDRLNELKQKYMQKDQVVEVNERANHDNNNGLRKIFEQAEVLGQWIEGIEKNNEEIRALKKRIDNISFNQKDVVDKLSSLFQNTTSIAQKITNKLKELDGEIKKANLESAEGRIKSIQYNTLKQRYKNAFLASNTELEHWRNIQKASIQAQLSAKGVNTVDDEELTSLLDEGKDIHVFTNNIIAETAEAKQLLADVEERHQQLLKIERMLIEVRDLFVQMAILVDTQQETINQIEYQAQNAINYVGAVDLKKVRKLKRKHMKMKIIIILVLIFILIILFIMLFK